MFERYGVESGMGKYFLGPWPGEVQMDIVERLITWVVELPKR
jgi:hypothetical protein